MIKEHRMNRFFTLLLAASCLTALSLRSTAQTLDEPHTFYQSDFSQNDFDGWSTTQTIEYDNRILLGNFSNETCSLTLSCLPAHTSLQLTFDVYALDTWDGNGSTGGPNDPDLWFASIDGNTLIETTFGHAFGVPQSYPANYPAHNDPFSGATQQCLETFCYGQICASAQYSMSFTLEHSLSNAEIIFGADLLQDICDESWALGDVVISLIGFVETPVAMGCTDSLACNFSEESTCDDGSCHFNCQFCHEGTVWDEDLFKCVVANPSDSNFDGCVQLNDLLDLLSAFGDCGAEESAWQCGDPLEYQGYDYETVQIGEQCWFAENLRAENYRNCEAIPSDFSNSEWEDIGMDGIGGQAVWGDDPAMSNLYGLLYNGYAVTDSRGICPFGWSAPTDSAFSKLEVELGMNEGAAYGSNGWLRGTNEGEKMKASPSDFPAWNGTNESGFTGLPAGNRGIGGEYSFEGYQSSFWTTTFNGPSYMKVRSLNASGLGEHIYRGSRPLGGGLSVRCIKDSE